MSIKLPSNKLSKYYAALIITYIIWGGASSVIKLTLEYIPPFTFLLFRFIIVGIILLPYAFITLRKTAIYKDDLVKIIILGVLAQSSLAFIFIGLRFTSAIESTIIGLLGPIFSVMAGHYYYHEKIDWHIKLGLGIATFGTLFVALEPIMSTGSPDAHTSLRLLGNFFVILYSISFLLYIIWSKIVFGQSSREIKRSLRFLHIEPMKHSYSPDLVSIIGFYVGLATFIPFALLENVGFFGDFYFASENLNALTITGILYMALLSTIVAYILFERGLEGADIKESAIFSYLQPIFALPFAYVLLGELPNKFMLIGCLFIAVGVSIAEIKKYKLRW